MPVPFWDDAPGAWDTLSLGGVTVPGLASVSGQVARKMDTRSRAGADGATVRDRGYEPAQLEIHVKVWTAEQLAQLEDLIASIHPRGVTQPSTPSQSRAERALERERQRQRALGEVNLGELDRLEAQVAAERARPRPRGTRTPLDIAHPATELLGIRRVYVTAVKLPELRGGEFITTISALEWTEAPRAAPPPATNAAGAGLDNIETEFDRARASAQASAGPPARVTSRGGS